MSEGGRQLILNRLFARLYGNPVVRNDLRGELVEEIIGLALEPDWALCGADWGGCDLIHEATGLRMQVKQSAARQSWSAGAPSAQPTPRFSIAQKTGRWEGATWIPGAGRNAELYVFAWHPVVTDDCDHADAAQWLFHVVPERALPPTKSIGLPQVRALAEPVDMASLRATVERTLAALRGAPAP